MTTIQTDQAAPATPKTEAWLIERYDANDKLVRSVVLAPLTDDVFLDESSEAIALCRVEAAAPQQAVAASSEPSPTLEIRLSEPHARALRDAIGDGCTQAVTLKVGDGHSGFGLYVWATEYPDDGAWLVKNLPPLSTNQPVQAKELTDDLIYQMAKDAGFFLHDEQLKLEYPVGYSEAQKRMLKFARALLASQPSAQTIEHQKAIDGWKEAYEYSERSLFEARQSIKAYQQHMNKDSWIYLGDGTDHIESMGNDMCVIITAARLRSLISNGSQPSAQADVAAVPAAVTEWYQAEKARIDAVHMYNARLKFVQEHLPFGTSVDPEYQLMHQAEKKARSLLKPMFDALDAAPTVAPARIDADFDVRNIVLRVVPGEHGMGEEIHAKDVHDVTALLTEQDERIESLQTMLAAAPTAQPQADGVKP